MPLAPQRLHTNTRLSKAVIHGGLIFLSGQTASGSDATSIEAQTQEALKRIDALLAEAGSGRSALLSATIYLRDMDDFAGMNRIWEAWLSPGHAPARCTVEANLASPHLLIEISVIAARA